MNGNFRSNNNRGYGNQQQSYQRGDRYPFNPDNSAFQKSSGNMPETHLLPNEIRIGSRSDPYLVVKTVLSLMRGQGY
jgi:hypothetical protein